eukprot:g374.t1
MDPPPAAKPCFVEESWSGGGAFYVPDAALAALDSSSASAELCNKPEDFPPSALEAWQASVNEFIRAERAERLHNAHKAMLEEEDMAREKDRLVQIEKRTREREEERLRIEREKQEELEAREKAREEARREREDTSQLEFTHDNPDDLDGFENETGGFLDETSNFGDESFL